MSYQERYTAYQEAIETYLNTIFSAEGKPYGKLQESIRYSLLAGGKRIRPVLTLEFARLGGIDWHLALPYACALELVHNYSLIHDDLPCMDDDDYRRGRLTNHKVFGEAMAVLAGDGLLTLAFEVMLEQKNVDPKVLIETVREMAMCAGNFGMVGGQGLDLEFEGKKITPEELRKLHAGKTGALFIAAIRGGAHLAGANDQQLLALTKFADLLGLAFQITDDILDVEGTEEELGKPVGSDAKNHKSTYVTLYGLQAAHELAEKTVAEALECLEMFGENAEPLREITRLMTDRKK